MTQNLTSAAPTAGRAIPATPGPVPRHHPGPRHGTDHPIVVIGAGYAGVMVANRLASHGAAVSLISEQPEFIERIRLHQLIAGTHPARRPLAELLHPGVTLVLARAQRIHPERDLVDLEAAPPLPYHRLVLATGSVPTAPPHCPDVATLTGALRARDQLAGLTSGDRVLVVGGGLTGVETASEIACARTDLRVVLLSPTLLPDLTPAARRRAEAVLRRQGVELVTGRYPEAPPAELTLWCGPLHATPLAAGSGLPVDDAGRVHVEADQRVVGHPRILAVGDAARHPANRRASCQSALPSGAAAADAVLADLRGEPAAAFRLQYTLRCISLGRDRALVQTSRGDDTARGPALGGRPAALVKEKVSSMTIRWLHAQAAGRDLRWRQ